ncbi:hypothetical protein [Mycolicibacter arupensis]|nr:hypothetical protein [Mycolicibacter arupensis]
MDTEPDLTPMERLTIAAVYAALISAVSSDSLQQRQEQRIAG